MPSRPPPSREESDAAISRLTKILAQGGQRRRQASNEAINQIGTLLGQNDPCLERERQRERRPAIIDAMKPGERPPACPVPNGSSVGLAGHWCPRSLILAIATMKLHRILLLIVEMMWTQSALAADAAIGRQLAQIRCAPCHIVESIERGDVLANSPSFNAIGRKFGFDTVLLVNAVLDPHPRMNMAITRHEAEDIAAYIATLAR